MSEETHRVMVIDPHDQHFMQIGTVLSDGRKWKTIDIGYGQPVSIEAWKVMHAGRAEELVRDAARLKLEPIVAMQKRAQGRYP